MLNGLVVVMGCWHWWWWPKCQRAKWWRRRLSSLSSKPSQPYHYQGHSHTKPLPTRLLESPLPPWMPAPHFVKIMTMQPFMMSAIILTLTCFGKSEVIIMTFVNIGKNIDWQWTWCLHIRYTLFLVSSCAKLSDIWYSSTVASTSILCCDVLDVCHLWCFLEAYLYDC